MTVEVPLKKKRSPCSNDILLLSTILKVAFIMDKLACSL